MSQIFKKTDRPIYSLVEWIDKHDIWLPELQRPYVWDRARVRDLFDSLYRWYPTWLIIFLENETEHQVKGIGEHHNTLQKIPQYVVIDGQQRLTALYASLRWFPVKKEDGTEEIITISFNPIEETFKVADAGTQRGQDWIYDIKDMVRGDDLLSISNDYLAHFREKYWNNPEEEQRIAKNIQKVHNIKNINFHCIEIFKTVSMEVVSEIFLRINSRWKALNNSDFILTLMSVYREEWRKLVEDFSTYTQKKNDIVTLWADEVIRILIGVGFKRAKLEDAYNYLKAQKGEFETLSKIISLVIDKHQWANFLVLIKDLWFIDSSLVTQQSLVMACYIFYLIGMNEYKLNFQQLGSAIKQYYIVMYLTQKYSSSAFETVLWKDFLKLQNINTAQGFMDFLKEEIDTYLTGDTWKITFPKDIITSSIRSPLFVAYTASQVYFQNPLLFRSVPVSKFFIDLKDKEAVNEKIDIDLHHIFPRQYLLDTYWADGIKLGEINQIANKVYLYNSDNKTISKKKPEEYIADFSKNWTISRDNNLESNCIPVNFWALSYEDFLTERRKRMLATLQKYVEAIMHPEKNKPDWNDDISLLLQEWENHKIEFKSSYRRNTYQQKRDDELKYQVIKTIDAFLNTDWGKLFVGVNDDGVILGIENDINLFQDKSIDSLLLDIDNLLNTHFSTSYALIKVSVIEKDNKKILLFDVRDSLKPVYFTIKEKTEFYIRKSASSKALTIEEAVSYINDHF